MSVVVTIQRPNGTTIRAYEMKSGQAAIAPNGEILVRDTGNQYIVFAAGVRPFIALFADVFHGDLTLVDATIVISTKPSTA